MIRLVNKIRTEEGLPALTTNSSLSNAAALRAEEIVTLYSHTRPDGSSCFTVLPAFGISYRACTSSPATCTTAKKPGSTRGQPSTAAAPHSARRPEQRRRDWTVPARMNRVHEARPVGRGPWEPKNCATSARFWATSARCPWRVVSLMLLKISIVLLNFDAAFGHARSAPPRGNHSVSATTRLCR